EPSAMTRGALAVLALLALVLAWSSEARAYPQFQLSTGNVRCNLCHFSPAGGGLINDYGRDEAEGSLSQTAGSGRLLHDLWQPPDWLALGGDVRVAGIIKQTGAEPELLAFPMQLDLYARA